MSACDMKACDSGLLKDISGFVVGSYKAHRWLV